MNLSSKEISTNDKKVTASKATALNPNAAEFIPSSLRSSSVGGGTSGESATFASSSTSTIGKAALDRSVSSVSHDSDDELHQYWQRQLPDDITPDFKVMGEDDSHEDLALSFPSLSLNEINEASGFPVSAGSGYMSKEQEDLYPHHISSNSITRETRYPFSSYGEDISSVGYSQFPTKPWDKQIVNNEQISPNPREGHPYDAYPSNVFLNDMLIDKQVSESSDVNPIEFLVSQFPGFAAESLGEVYFASGGDLNLTIEMLTQLELQVDGGVSQTLNSDVSSAPKLSANDFPALSAANSQDGMLKYVENDMQQSVTPYPSSEKDSGFLFKSGPSFTFGGATDFASAVRKMNSQESSVWKYDKNGSSDSSVGSSRNPHILSSSYNGFQGKGTLADKFPNRGSARAAPVWLETGEAVANMYSEMREEARDHARIRNAYFEQARQAYLIGNKALAKELSAKGQFHNMQMKAAHEKAQESIYRLRNPVSGQMQANGRGQERIIDLHGLHVSEAFHVLKRELAVLRNAARSAVQRLPVYICVGTGHHTKGSRTPARLPIAVQRYLLEEGLDYSEPQPGLLRVVIH